MIYTLFFPIFALLFSLSVSAIPTTENQINALPAGRRSQIAGFFALYKVNPRCRSRCQAAGQIVSTCQNDSCICNNKDNEALSICLTCGLTAPNSDLEKEAAACNMITFFLDVCSPPLDAVSSQSTVSINGTTSTSASATTTATVANAQSTTTNQSSEDLGKDAGIAGVTSPLTTQVATDTQEHSVESNGMTPSRIAKRWVVTVVMIGSVLVQT